MYLRATKKHIPILKIDSSKTEIQILNILTPWERLMVSIKNI